MTTALEGVRGQPHTPAVFTPGKDPVLIEQDDGWAPWPVWTGAENLAPPVFHPRTVQPVASRYTDYATRPTLSTQGLPLNNSSTSVTYTVCQCSRRGPYCAAIEA